MTAKHRVKKFMKKFHRKKENVDVHPHTRPDRKAAPEEGRVIHNARLHSVSLVKEGGTGYITRIDDRDIPQRFLGEFGPWTPESHAEEDTFLVKLGNEAYQRTYPEEAVREAGASDSEASA